MDAIVKMLEKHQPFFEKISRNIYLQAIKDGFLGCMPIVLTSSIFLLIATLPGVVGITLPQPLIDWCNKLYNFTMGVMGIMVAGTTAKNFTASMNRRMPAGKVLNDGSTMVAAQCSMLLLAVTQFTTKFNGSELSVFDCTSMGTRGLFSAYIAAFITVWVYKFCVSRDLTIKLPKEVPGAIAQNFRDIIPFGGAVIICGIIDVVVRNLMGGPFSELLIKLLSPLFTAAETYPGLILIQAATAFFWFIGVHGPSIVQPGIDPIRLANQAENLQVLLAGGHPAHSLTFNMSLVGEFGGTGATFIVPLLLILFMKSKQLKAVGKASIVPVAFAVNEPLLFGAPMILNPYMLIPFVAAGCVNVSVAKFFIDNVGMNGFSFVVPWATPAPIGIFITTNFQLIALVFVAIIILLDAIIYLPFLKAYDKLLCDQEAERAAELLQLEQLAAELVEAGADGIVTGVLTPEGQLDAEAMRPIYAAARRAAEKAGRPVACTLHRAFDVSADPFAALETVRNMGLCTILTSGQAASAPEGAELLGRLVERAGDSVEILVGAGVTAQNIPALAAQTGAHAFHLSGKQVLQSRMTFRREGVPMGLPGFSEFEVWQTGEENIRAARQALDAIKNN